MTSNTDLKAQLAAIDMRSNQAEWDRVDTLLEAAEVTPPPAPDAAAIAGIAKGLTKAQREMVMTDDKYFNRQWKGYWRALTAATGKRLHALGLVEKPEALARPTPLGLAVRASLAQSKGEE